MKNLIFLLCLLFSLPLVSQKFEVGTMVGVGIQSYTHETIQLESGVSIQVYVPQNHSNVQGYWGFYYRKNLTPLIALEVAPQLLRHHFNLLYSNVNPQVLRSKYMNVYVPICAIFDLGHQIDFRVGVGSMFKLTSSSKLDQVASPASPEGEKAFEAIMAQFHKSPLQLEVGLSYGLGRFSINGRYIYQVTSQFRTFTLGQESYPINYRSDFFRLGLSYRLFGQKAAKS